MKIVLVGAGLAAQRCCQALRRRGHDGPITLVGDEGVLPYDRPPLSKERLAGRMDDAALTLRPRSWYDEHGVELALVDPAVALDHHAVRLASGAALPYDRVLIATGAQPLPLPGTGDFENVHLLRSARDAAALADRLRPGFRLAIVGAGFVGQEVAATARSLGVDVTLIEAAPTPLHGPLGPQLGAWFAELHRAEGVRVLLNARIARFHGRAGRLDGVVLDDGRELACDALLVGIGVRPDTALARELPGCRRRAPDRRARRDRAARRVRRRRRRARRPLGGRGRPGRRRRARHARPRAAHASPARASGATSTASASSSPATPRGADAIELDGDPAARDFTALFLRDGVVRAGLLVGRPRALPALRDQLDHPISDRRTA